jgi:hypothetical protein
MSMPGFHAEESLYRSVARYVGGGASRAAPAGSVIPARPYCGNCPEILDRCYRNGWKPRGLCNMCYYGNCYTEPFPS